MSRIVWVFAVLGATVPVILQMVARASLFLNPTGIPAGRLLWPYLWPTYFLLGATARPETSILVVAVVFTIALFLNALIYALIGLVAASVWQFISKWK